MTKSDQNRLMREFQERCRTLGLSVTYQRLSIYRALLQLTGHPSPDDVYQLVKRAYPSISLATVYKTLERLERAGLISKPNIIHETARYEHRVGHHHHLVCVSCKRLDDLDPDELAADLPREAQHLGLPESVRREYEISDYTITFRGVCRACKRSGANGNGRAPAGSSADAVTPAETR
jgi:Fur family transcriptional regulator, peroxide stress response regulator